MTLVFVGVLVTAVALDLWVIRPWEKKHLHRAADHTDISFEFTVPRTLFFHPGHTWVRLDDDGRITVGVDDLARTLIGDLAAVDLPSVGEHLTTGRPAFAVRQGQRRLRFLAPVSGTVTEVNTALGRDPVRLRWHPYKEGWTLRMAPDDQLASQLGGMAIGRDAERWMSQELERLGRRFERGDLASPVEGALQRAGDDVWALLEREIFKIDGGSAEMTT